MTCKQSSQYGIAAIFHSSQPYGENDERYFAKILFDGALQPVDFFRMEDYYLDLMESLALYYPHVEVIPLVKFEHELEHIIITGERSNVPVSGSILEEVPEINLEKPLTSDQILSILAQSNQVLAMIDEATNKIRKQFGRNVEDARIPERPVEDPDNRS